MYRNINEYSKYIWYQRLFSNNLLPGAGGKIIFTLNSHTIFLTVVNVSGYLLLQTSTGVLNKKYKQKKGKKSCYSWSWF